MGALPRLEIVETDVITAAPETSAGEVVGRRTV